MKIERKPTTIDLLAFIATTALGLALCVAFYRSYWQVQFRLPPVPPSGDAIDVNSGIGESPAVAFDEVGMRATRYFSYVTLLLCAWTPCLLYIRLRKPRESMRELVCAFGTSACVTVMVILVAQLASFALQAISMRLVLDDYAVEWISAVPDFSGHPGPAIAASWLILLLIGERRFRRSWIESLELLLAMSWIFVYFGPTVANLVRLV
jgi:hypothetical protein